MRTRIQFWSVCLLFLAPCFGQELLDRIAVTVGSDVITEGEVYDQIRLTDFLNREPLDFGKDEKRKAAERLVEQQLIRREMQINRYPEPESTEADKMLSELIRKRFDGNHQAYEAALKQYEVAEDALKANLLWQLTALRFTDLRFRPNLTNPEPLREGLEQKTEQRTAAKAGAPVKPERGEPKTDNAEDYASLAQRKEAAQKAVPPSVDQQLAKWLDEARSRARVEYRKDVFQ